MCLRLLLHQIPLTHTHTHIQAERSALRTDNTTFKRGSHATGGTRNRNRLRTRSHGKRNMSRTYFRIKHHHSEASAVNAVCSENPSCCNFIKCSAIYCIWISQEKIKLGCRIMRNDNGLVRGARQPIGQGRPVQHLTDSIQDWMDSGFASNYDRNASFRILSNHHSNLISFYTI
jgi:hypothetical protein